MNKAILLKLISGLGLIVALTWVIISDINIGSQFGNKAQTQDGAVAQVNQTINFDSSKEAIINEKFESAIQACWYHQATYKTLHPYTVLWEKALCQKPSLFGSKLKISECNSNDDEIPELRIRVIADKGILHANTCIKEKDESDDKMIVKLIGEEFITHRVEAQFEDKEPYIHIATTDAKYNSTFHFNDKGKIVHRKVKKTDSYKCIFPDDARDDFPQISESSSIPSSCELVYKKTEEPVYKDGSISYTNEITISGPIFDIVKEIKKYKTDKVKDHKLDEKDKEKYILNLQGLSNFMKALEFYIKKRNELHDDLLKTGCGAISLHPDYLAEKGSVELARPSIIYVCHKEGKHSHVRVMMRESLEDKRKRENKQSEW